MIHVIVLFPKIEEAKRMRNLLVRYGFSVPHVCTTGAQALSAADALGSGIVLCGYRYVDMLYTQLRECLPKSFSMLLVASRQIQEEYGGADILCVPMPLKAYDLLNSLELMAANLERQRKRRKQRPALRSLEEEAILKRAKGLLMERNQMTEEEAHRYLQKCSMDSGRNLVETARMSLQLLDT